MVSHAVLAASVTRSLEALVAANPGQATLREYRIIWQAIAARRGGNVLVFGVGRDSPQWIDANAGGQVTFVEHEPAWIAVARDKTPGIDVVPTRYTTRAWAWRLSLLRPHRLYLRNLPSRIHETSWDVILVDGPQGYNRRCPGRMSSIYTASRLAQRSAGRTEVFVHDADREIERACGDRFLGEANLVRHVDRLRQYRV
ncbi:MAG: hypothetical protein B7733_20880 [Myxococcales bacterium FL481]|nr:MAG: hypothetical protein B7733_20880 [Myxococcales bacterium FL481]